MIINIFEHLFNLFQFPHQLLFIGKVYALLTALAVVYFSALVVEC